MQLFAVWLTSNFTPLLLEKAKDWRWFPFMSNIGRFAPILNRVTPLVAAAVVASGVHWTFDAAEGRLVVDGLMPQHMINGVALWVVGAFTQHYRYHKTIKGD